MKRLTIGLAAALGALGLVIGWVHAQNSAFPQLKINHVDASEAPLMKVYFSLLGSTMKPATLNQVSKVTVFSKPDKGKAVELLGVADGEPVWPKGMSADDIEAKEDSPPELLPAVDIETGASIVVVVPGFQDDDYRTGTLGERSRSGAGLFFKKLGKTNLMNVVWYNDFVWTYVYTQGRLNELTRLDTQLDRCAKWEEDNLYKYGAEPEEEEEEVEGPKKDEAQCGLTAEYADIPKILAKMPYNGFWPQLWGLDTNGCSPPEHKIQRTGLRSTAEGDNPFTRDDRASAMDVALEMLVKGGTPGQPKILILTGDGRDGYIRRHDDCKTQLTLTCSQAGGGRAGVRACIDADYQKILISDQTKFRKKLEGWVSLAKSAGIRIFSVVHPTAKKYQAERLQVLAWRTGGTARVAEDANEVVDHYDDLIAELNHQFVLKFVDDDAVAGATLSYEIKAEVGSSNYPSKPYTFSVSDVAELPFLAGIQKAAEAKLGKAGFFAVLIGVGLILALILLKVFGKIFKGVGGSAKKAAKKGKGGAKGADKAKEKLKAKMKAKAKAKG